MQRVLLESSCVQGVLLKSSCVQGVLPESSCVQIFYPIVKLCAECVFVTESSSVQRYPEIAACRVLTPRKKGKHRLHE